MNKFKVGDKVKIREDLKVGCAYNGSCSFVLEMEKYKVKTAVIKKVYIPVYLNDTVENANDYRYELDIDDGYWCWSSSMLEKVEYKKHFKSLPRNFTGTVKIKNGLITEIVKKKEILDKVEKEYLGSVIKPFKEKVTGIAIREFSADKCYLYIDIIGDDGFGLPNFKRGTMYKNMEIDRNYTLEELELD